eukprot:1815956-Prorocentrum_lima.AAC.1
MTSSLVGSEMCIRDSPGLGVFLNYPLATRTRFPGLGCFSFPRGDVLAVSYTHLTLPTICSV